MNHEPFHSHPDPLVGDVGGRGGEAIAEPGLRSDDAAHGFADAAKQALGTATDAIADPAPTIARAKAFAKDRPWATAALVGTIGLALYNTLRGRR